MAVNTLQIPDNIPVSWLPNHPTLDSEMLFLVSVPSEKSETGFMSKYITFRDLKAGLQELFKIDDTHTTIEQISADYFPILNGFSSNTICCDVGNPYVISSIVQKDGNISSVSGYRLSSMLESLHRSVAFNTIKAKNIEIAGWSGNNPLKSLYGYKLVDQKFNTNIRVSHHTFNYCYPLGGTPQTLSISFEPLQADAASMIAGTQLEFKVYVDNTRPGVLATHTINWSGLGGEILVKNGSSENISTVGVGERSLFIVQSMFSSSGPFFIDKIVLTKAK